MVASAVTLAVAYLIACQTPPANTGSVSADSLNAAPAARFHSNDGPSRDLSQDEAAGGHVLRKHVGQSEAQLRQRLARDPNLVRVSTYMDRQTAERTVGAAIAQSRGNIERWLSSPGRHANLVLDYDSDTAIGRTMSRGEFQSHVCRHAVVVLKYDGPDQYYVLTSYPECRS